MFIPRLLPTNFPISIQTINEILYTLMICSAICFLMNRDVKGVVDIGTGESTPLGEIVTLFRSRS